MHAQLEWWTPQKNFGVQPKSKSICSAPGGQTPTTQTRDSPRDVRFIFSMRSNFLGLNETRVTFGRPNETMKLLTTCLNSLVFESPCPGYHRIVVIFLVGNPNLNLHLWPLASWEGWQPKVYAMLFQVFSMHKKCPFAVCVSKIFPKPANFDSSSSKNEQLWPKKL